MIAALLTVGGLALLAGIALSLISRRLPPDEDSLVATVNTALPQTQCAQCGYPGCRPYAQAIVEQGEAINRCPPGGDKTLQRLAELTGRPVIALEVDAPARQVAVIDESLCIGCLHCRDACPVDAIFGAQGLMHTVIATECTGCELCIEPCPVDCIDLERVA